MAGRRKWLEGHSRKPWAHFFELLAALSWAQCHASGRKRTSGEALPPPLHRPALAPLSPVLGLLAARCPLPMSMGLQGIYYCSGAGDGFPSQAQLQFGQELRMRITSTQIVTHLWTGTPGTPA